MCGECGNQYIYDKKNGITLSLFQHAGQLLSPYTIDIHYLCYIPILSSESVYGSQFFDVKLLQVHVQVVN
jgi:hypothetical protein